MKSHITTAFETLTDSSEVAGLILGFREDLRRNWSPNLGGRDWGRDHSDLMDVAVEHLFSLAASRAGGDCINVTVLATGGYGQRCLSPWSDIDLTFLVDRRDDPLVLREAFQLVMDVLLSACRIKVGYAYRTMDEIRVGALDHQTQTALLDGRYVCGDKALYDKFDTFYLKSLQTADFLFQKQAERSAVRKRCGDSPFLLEPDVKEGAGGLRDIHTAQWMAHVRFGKSGDALYRELVRRKVISQEESLAFRTSREYLLTVRNVLHLTSGERRDKLALSRQEACAEKLQIKGGTDRPAVELFMKEYYQHAAFVSELALKIANRCLDGPLRLSVDSVAVQRNQIIVTEHAQAQNAREWVPVALDVAQRLGIDLAPATIELIQAKGHELGPVVLSKLIIQSLTTHGRNHIALRTLLRSGLLERVLPEFTDAMNLIAYDPAHAFTVGEHSLNVLANLVELVNDKTTDDDRESYRHTVATIESIPVIFMAALLHDLGKQWPRDKSGQPAPHEITGAERIPEICARLGCSNEMTVRVQTMVRYHLLLADTARLRDLSRRETALLVTQLLGDSDMLRMLYVFTYADIMAVGPGIWTKSSALLLDELVERCETVFASDSTGVSQEDESYRLLQVRSRIQRRLIGNVEGGMVDPVRVQIHIDNMPASYLLSTKLDDIRLHVEMAHTLLSEEAERPVVIDVRGTASDPDSSITIVAFDDPNPGLLAKLTGVLYALDLRLHSAQVFTRKTTTERHIVIDTLRVDFRGRGLSRSLRNDIVICLEKVISGIETVGSMIETHRRPAAILGRTQDLSLIHIDHEILLVDVRLVNDSSAVHALCRNVTGAGWNIAAARLTQCATGTRCALYVSDAKKRPVDGAKDQLRDLLLK